MSEAKCTNCVLSTYMCDVLGQQQLHTSITTLKKGTGDKGILLLTQAPSFDNITMMTNVHSILSKLDIPDEVSVYLSFAVGCNYPEKTKLSIRSVNACAENVEAMLGRLAKKHKNFKVIACGEASIASIGRIDRAVKKYWTSRSWQHFLPRINYLSFKYFSPEREKSLMRKVRVFTCPDLYRVTRYVESEDTFKGVVSNCVSSFSGSTAVNVDVYNRTLLDGNEFSRDLKKKILDRINSLPPTDFLDVAFDIETNSLYGYREDSTLLTFAIAYLGAVSGSVDAFCIPYQHREANHSPSRLKEVYEFLVFLFSNQRIRIIAHGGAFDFAYLKFLFPELIISNWKYDTMILCSLMGSPKGTRGLKYQAYKVLGVNDYTQDLETDEETGHKNMADTKLHVLARYNMDDSIYTLLLHEKYKFIMKTTLKSRGVDIKLMWELYSTRLSVTMNTLVNITVRGIQICAETREKYVKIYGKEIHDLSSKLESFPEVVDFEETYLNDDYVLWRDDYEKWLTVIQPGKKKPNMYRKKPPEYNKIKWGSSTQVAKFAIEHQGLPVVKTTPAGKPSMDSEVLESYAVVNPIFQLLMKLRVITKEVSTYINPMPNFVGTDGRLHAKYNLGFTDSGRLSCQDPNLQNVKSRGHALEEYKVKNIFKVGNGRIMWAFDYSQAELRVLCSIANDIAMINMFLRGEDPHAGTGSVIFNVPIEAVQEYQRFAGKTTNFGIVYQMGLLALAEKIYTSIFEKLTNLNPDKPDKTIRSMAIQEGQEMLDGLMKSGIKLDGSKSYDNTAVPKVFIKAAEYILAAHKSKFKGIWSWIEQTKSGIRSKGFSISPLGRVFFLPNAASSDRRLVAEAMRTGVNAPIQGTASDMTCEGLNRIENYLSSEGIIDKIFTVNQVHDAIYGEAPAEPWIIPHLMKIKELLEDTKGYSFMKVPFLTDFEIGTSWGKLEKVKEMGRLPEILERLSI